MNTIEFTDRYYEHHWSNIEILSPREEERINQTLSLIPENCSSILDIGCGDGRITNRLISRYGRIVGLERSREALQHVKAEKILGSADALPFSNKSFDLVICCEVLEHLPFEVYPKVLEEIKRVATKYIIVTVPNNEDREQLSVTCSHCGCVFNPWRHLRSFNHERLKGLFSEFRLHDLQLCLLENVYPSFLIKGAKFVGLLPRNPFPATSLCPQCGYTPHSLDKSLYKDNTTNKDTPSIQLIRPLARWLIPTKKAGGWLMALYHRNQIDLVNRKE